jgi:hypothetical protein
MKHMVRIPVTVAAGHEIEKRPGGPGPVMSRLAERFRPDAMYMCPARREVFMVCNLETADMAELMIAGSNIGGQYPEFLPVIEAKEFGGVVGKAMTGAKKLIEG